MQKVTKIEKQFRVCTISNSTLQYEAMKASFVVAGFDEDRCSYSLFDNSVINLYDPYDVISAVVAESVEPYIIYCHQDILLDQGHGYDELLNVIREINSNDPSWAILGNAGVTEDHRLIRRLQDPFGNDCGGDDGPERVCSLDENFLVIRTASNVHCSAGLKGFHLYATDLCLQATQAGYSCYVVSFHLTHRSRGRVDQSFQVDRANFQKHWSQRFRYRYVQTTCTTIFLSRNNAIRFFFSSHRVTQWLFSSPFGHKIMCQFSDRFYAA